MFGRPLFAQCVCTQVPESSICRGFSGLTQNIHASVPHSLSLPALPSAVFHGGSGTSSSNGRSHPLLQAPRALLAACETASLSPCPGVAFSITGERSHIHKRSLVQLYFLPLSPAPRPTQHSEDPVPSVVHVSQALPLLHSIGLSLYQTSPSPDKFWWDSALPICLWVKRRAVSGVWGGGVCCLAKHRTWHRP